MCTRDCPSTARTARLLTFSTVKMLTRPSDQAGLIRLSTSIARPQWHRHLGIPLTGMLHSGLQLLSGGSSYKSLLTCPSDCRSTGLQCYLGCLRWWRRSSPAASSAILGGSWPLSQHTWLVLEHFSLVSLSVPVWCFPIPQQQKFIGMTPLGTDQIAFNHMGSQSSLPFSWWAERCSHSAGEL